MVWLVEFIKNNGNLSVFLGGFLEEIIIPIPSPLISITAGAFLVKQKELWPALFSIFTKVSLPFSIGATIGSAFAYLLAFFGGKFFIEKMEKFFGFSWKTVEKTREKFIKGSGDEVAIVLLRAIPIVPVSLVSVVCGAVRLDWKGFYFFTFLGLIIRSFILGFIGWQAGITYQSWIEGIDKVETIILGITLVFLLSLLGFFYFRREKILEK